AVVFQRRDQYTGDVRYIYHGNDGTSFPWNDTAQLDYSKAHVREAVIQTILHVARNFPVIRVDAAMTLAKKHIERLWFPPPGEGGAIPSRSEHGMSRAEFDAAMPNEFWREVVDRVAAEVPDTLLLAEAFWLMEGYFVRTLGMHRVYNSAFMHMLRDEDNAKYRLAIKNTLEFDPQILKRYVNFMNNPDEKTAVEQFGNGDKYFGVCTVLSTLPGLPMFGHGQVEGYREKYGMEFRKPKWDEMPDEGLIGGHEWKIFPLLHRRYIFADVDNFLLFDLFREDGYVDENVFAYSNRSSAGERGLVIYHNKFTDTRGWIRTSAAYLDKASGELVQKSLAEGLGLPQTGYVIFRDYVDHMEYMRSCGEIWEKGLFVQLGAYQHHAFLDWRFVDGDDWRSVFEALNGAAVPSVDARWQEAFGNLAPLPAAEEPVAATARKRLTRKRAAQAAATKTAKKGAAKKAAKATKATAKKTGSKSTTKASRKNSVTPAAKKSKTTSTKPAKTTSRSSKKKTSEA
ncbi:MAG: alpha-amylase, partial [Anaerolineae bacterium]